MFNDLSGSKSKNNTDRMLTVIMVISVVILVAVLVYVIVVPVENEFTELYLLDLNHKIEEYPKYLDVGENISFIIGVTNHEYKTINYSIEIWLINQTVVYNSSINETEIVYHNMWFIDKIDVILESTNKYFENSWQPQWEYNYSFSINRNGSFKLALLLFRTPTEEYNVEEDYIHLAEQKISNAYRKTYLLIFVD